MKRKAQSTAITTLTQVMLSASGALLRWDRLILPRYPTKPQYQVQPLS